MKILHLFIVAFSLYETKDAFASLLDTTVSTPSDVTTPPDVTESVLTTLSTQSDVTTPPDAAESVLTTLSTQSDVTTPPHAAVSVLTTLSTQSDVTTPPDTTESVLTTLSTQSDVTTPPDATESVLTTLSTQSDVTTPPDATESVLTTLSTPSDVTTPPHAAVSVLTTLSTQSDVTTPPDTTESVLTTLSTQSDVTTPPDTTESVLTTLSTQSDVTTPPDATESVLTTLSTQSDVTTPPDATESVLTTLSTPSDVTTPPHAAVSVLTTLSTQSDVTTPPDTTESVLTTLSTQSDVTTPPDATESVLTTLSTPSDVTTPPDATESVLTTLSTQSDVTTAPDAAESVLTTTDDLIELGSITEATNLTNGGTTDSIEDITADGITVTTPSGFGTTEADNTYVTATFSSPVTVDIGSEDYYVEIESFQDSNFTIDENSTYADNGTFDGNSTFVDNSTSVDNSTEINLPDPVEPPPYYLNYTLGDFVSKWQLNMEPEENCTVTESGAAALALPDDEWSYDNETGVDPAFAAEMESAGNVFVVSDQIGVLRQRIEEATWCLVTTTTTEATTTEITTIVVTAVPTTTQEIVPVTIPTECYQWRCENGGEYCPNESGNYKCLCPEGWFGTYCQRIGTKIFEGCRQILGCKNGGEFCPNVSGNFACLCAPGWTGVTCEQVAVISNGTAVSDDSAPTPTVLECTADGPCLNEGRYCPDAMGTYVCNCTNNFIGDLCEELNLNAAAEIDFSAGDAFVVAGDVFNTLITGAVGGGNVSDFGSLDNVSSSIDTFVENLASANWTSDQLESVGASVVQGSSSILSALSINSADETCTKDESGVCAEAKSTAAVVERVLDSVNDLGNVVLKAVKSGNFEVRTEKMNVTFTKASAADLIKDSDAKDVVLPQSLLDLVGDTGVILSKMDIDKDVYKSPGVTIAAPIKRLALQKEDGGAVGTLDPDDPLRVTVEATSNETFKSLALTVEGATLTAVQEVTLSSSSPVTLVELEIPPGKQLLYKGRFGELPRNYERDFEATVHTAIQETVSNKYVRSQLVDGELVLIFQSSKITADTVFLVLEYTDTIGGNRRKRSFSNPSMRSRILAPKVWNPTTLTWDTNPNVQLSGISSTGQAQFKSNFFGTFAVSEMIVAPTPIDFNRLFLNFATYLEDSPYVLAVNCFLVAMTILVAILLRRLDNSDNDLWLYYPLVDNTESAPYSYSISVHTSLGSSKKFKETPCFILSGSEGKTNTRFLTDGYRKNFVPGTVSNFLMTTDASLGALEQIKVWHNGDDSAKWHLDRIVIVDLQNNIRYLFACQKWLALGEDDGRLCRTFESFTDKTGEISMLDMVSKQKLFDDHLWLSVIKRPSFSRFSRVQRFLCAVAMLFLSMVTSAMWYQDYDTGSQKSTGLEIGPLKLNYRQVFVGAASALIIVAPGVLMTLSFKRRLFRGEKNKQSGGCCSCFDYVSGKKLFPWWFIFVGYSLIIASIATSAFFTFMYSLQWGGPTSLNWLMSLFFCTTGSTAMVEPVKIIVLALALSTLFKKGATEDIATVAPLEKPKDIKIITFGSPKSTPEPPDEDSAELEERRRKLFLKNKLIDLGKNFGIRIIFVGLIAVICLHNDVGDSYRLNTFIKSYANEAYIAKNVNSRASVWTWLNSVLIPGLLPKTHYNSQLMSVYDQRFTTDQANVRIGPISLRQYRVKDNCEYNILPSRYGMPMLCRPEYNTQSAEIRTFKQGWQSCNSNGSDCTEKPFSYTSSVGGTTTQTEGVFSNYGDGSYIESWDQDQTYASSRNKFLQLNDWLDMNTRALIVEASLYNPNVGLFNRLQVLFEFGAIGSVTPTVDVKSAKLYPYVSVWDYLVLLLQIIFGVIVLARLVKFCREAFCVNDSMSVFSALMFGVEMLLSLAAMTVYGVKIDRTIFVVEELVNNPENYVSFDLVHVLDEMYRLLMSLLLFLRIILLLGPMSFSEYLFYMRATLAAAKRELFSFALVLMSVVTAFASMFYLLEGPVTKDIRSMSTVYMTLFQGLLGMAKSNQFHYSVSGLEMYVKQIMFVFFFFASTMILMNIAIIILCTDLAAIQGHAEYKMGEEYDHELGEYFWESLSGVMNKLFTPKRKVQPMDDKKDDASKEPDMKMISENVDNIKIMLDKVLRSISISNNSDNHVAQNIANRALSRLSSARRHIEFLEEEVDKQDDQDEHSYLEDLTDGMEDRPTYAADILRLDDSTGRACLVLYTHRSNPINVTVHDVTVKEQCSIRKDLRALYGRIYKCESTINLKMLRVQFLVTTDRHPYEDIAIAVRSAQAKKWTFLKSSLTRINTHDKIVAVIEADCEFTPDFVTVASESLAHVQTITPEGGEFSLPFEPEAKFTYQPECVYSPCDVTIKLIPKQPVPIVHILPSGNLLSSISVKLPVASTDLAPKRDLVVLCSTANSKWWIMPTQPVVKGNTVEFKAYIGPANITVSLCVKVLEMPMAKKRPVDKTDNLSSDALTTICEMVNKEWPDLAGTLGVQGPHIYMMMYHPKVTSPVEICRHMLTLWYKQAPVNIDKARHLRQALLKMSRKDVVNRLDEQESAAGFLNYDIPGGPEMVRAITAVARQNQIADCWTQLADAFCLSAMDKARIDCETPRTDSEKLFLVLVKWCQANPVCTVQNLQTVLIKAGFPLLARKLEGVSPQLNRRQSFTVSSKRPSQGLFRRPSFGLAARKVMTKTHHLQPL